MNNMTGTFFCWLDWAASLNFARSCSSLSPIYGPKTSGPWITIWFRSHINDTETNRFSILKDIPYLRHTHLQSTIPSASFQHQAGHTKARLHRIFNDGCLDVLTTTIFHYLWGIRCSILRLCRCIIEGSLQLPKEHHMLFLNRSCQRFLSSSLVVQARESTLRTQAVEHWCCRRRFR